MKKKITQNNKIKDIYTHPIGKDILTKIFLQLNLNEKIIINPLIGNLKIKYLSNLSKKFGGENLVNSLLQLLNSEIDVPKNDLVEIKEVWWKEAVFYQIYPRSFKDSNGDGIGDLGGILEKLDYLKTLGIDAIWISPIYDSPNDDNGYDIRDYYNILKEFGTMADFDNLLKETHRRGMRLIIDLVVNHTSDEHPWFQAALKNPNSKYKDYYLFKEHPNNWTSFFSGSAWNYYEEQNKWALHLFSKKQMDLNWENADLRDDILNMIRWWLEKGVDGFRLDVINYISKAKGLPDGNLQIGELMGYRGIEHYFYGPNLHQYLKQLNQEAFKPYHAFSVGETPGIGMEMGKLLTGNYRNELDMIFSFDHLESPGYKRFDDYEYDLNYLKKYLITWTENYTNYCWQSLFYENHDNPRMISKITKDDAYRNVLAKLLAAIQLTLKGTPFIYQGQEIGSVNQRFKSIDDMRDIESINLYQELTSSLSEEEALKKVLAGSRDHARTPVQWNEKKFAGFSTVKPWIEGDEDYKHVNIESQLQDSTSVLNFYKQLIQLRKKYSALIYGEVEFIDKNKKNSFNFFRKGKKEMLFITCNLGKKYEKKRKVPENYQVLLSNYLITENYLRPYEVIIYLIK